MLRKELTEYNTLYNTLGKLHVYHEKQKADVSLLFKQLIKIRSRLVKELGKTSCLLKHMTMFQKNQIGLSQLNEKLKLWEKDEILFIPLLKPELAPIQYTELVNTKEIKSEEIRLINMIDGLKKKQLRLELIGMRLGELLLSIGKAIEAYNYQWKQIYWTIFPLGIFSALYKRLKKMLGKHYFTPSDINEIAVIGNLGISIIKMANAPII